MAWVSLSSGPFKGSAVPEVARYLKNWPSTRAFLDQPVEVFKKDRKTRVALHRLPNGKRVVCKHFLNDTAFSRLRASLGYDKGTRAYRASRMACEAGLPCPEVLGIIREGHKRLVVMTELMQGYNDLRQFASHPQVMDELARYDILPRVAQLLAKMHEAGMAHGDAKWANVMFREADGDLAFIDVDGVSRTRRGWCPEHARDIARFLLDCEEAGCPPVDTHSRFLEDYAEARQLRVKNMDVAVIKALNRLRLKHEKRYGPGHRLTPKTTT